MEFRDDEIAAEAYRIWEADGRPMFTNDHDHWFRAVENLRKQRSAERDFGISLPIAGTDIAR